MAILPPYFEGKDLLPYGWFPTRAQCFIYRNWEMLTPARMAKILEADEATVCRMAADMGLAENAADERLWLSRGYVTLIRANWHLLTYAQLCTMLGWEESYLAFILHEDDFLDVKLGRHKPNVPPLCIEPLTEDGKRQTAAIFRVTRELSARLGKPALPPFAFSAVYPKDTTPVTGESRLTASFLCPYETLYGDLFYDHALIDAAFPEDMLEAYAALGVGGLLCQAVLYALVPCKYDPTLSEGWQIRQEGLRRVIARLARHGLKLYLYINEPRELADTVFEKHPHLKGDVTHEGYASLCLSVPEAQDFLRDSIRALTESAPGLGGYLAITASENHTNCYSHKRIGETTCPRCRDKSPSDLYALVNRLIYEGATAADPSITVIAGNWAWDTKEPDGARLTVRKLPKEVAAWAVSERGTVKRFEDTEVSVADYSISIPGPSEKSLAFWQAARENGGRIAAKLQLSNSWELSPLPYIPALRHFYTAIRDLMEKAAPEIVHMTWTMGGFPSPAVRMFAEMTRKDAPMPAYEDMVTRYFPSADRGALLRALDALDAAFDEFPFSVISMYNGPQHMGPALPLWEERTGYASCMVGPIYDDMATCAIGYPPDLFLRQYDKLAAGWEKGFSLLLDAFRDVTPTEDERLLLDCAEVALLHFRSARNHLRYVTARPEDPEAVRALIREEEALAIREAELMGKNPTVGFEATNHYFFTRTDLFEKVLCCRRLLGEL